MLYLPLGPTPHAVFATRPHPSCCICHSAPPLMLYLPLGPTPHAVFATWPHPSCCICHSAPPLMLYLPLGPTPHAVFATWPHPSCCILSYSTRNGTLTSINFINSMQCTYEILDTCRKLVSNAEYGSLLIS